MPRRNRPDPLAQVIGQRLRQLREQRGLTAEKVAYESDVGSKGFLSDIEHGLALPSLQTLDRLAKYLEVQLFDRRLARTASSEIGSWTRPGA